MKRYWLFLSLLALPLFAAEKSEYAFHLAGRDFTHKEAREIAGSRSDLKNAILENTAAAAAIVLCSRENIELSAARTRDFLHKNLMLMPPESQQKFRDMLSRSGLTESAWLTREQARFSNQLSEAVVQWYIKVYGKDTPVTDEHVQNWYYRNMDIFRRIKLDSARILTFKAVDTAKAEKALAALRQAVPFAAVQKEFAENLSEKAILEELHTGNIKRRITDDNYLILTGSKHIFVTSQDAITHTALPLDEDLKKAISNALQEALAKARLAETLKQEFNNQKIVFY